MQTQAITVSDALLGSDFITHGATRVQVVDGFIQSVTSDVASESGPRRLLMPAFANAHDHGRPLSTTSFGAGGKPLETWLLRLAAIPSVDPYLAAVAALGRAAEGGCAAVMIHCTRPQGLTPLAEEVEAVARAATDVGVRLAFAVALRDRNPVVYGDETSVAEALPPQAREVLGRYFRTPSQSWREQLALVNDIATKLGGGKVNVQYGPTGVQWCSDEMLAGIAEASAATGRRVHMHLLETRYQREYADRLYPGGVVRHLHDIGLLSPRLTLAHCVWARPDELALIAESGATIAVNTSSNLHLHSGIAPLRRMLDSGCRVALGLDGCALDEYDDALRELRLGALLHAAPGFGEPTHRGQMLRAATAHGRASLGLTGTGSVAQGEPADWITLDLDHLDRDGILRVEPQDLLFARATKAHLDEVVVAGKTIVQRGKLVSLDLDQVHEDLRDRFRRALSERADFCTAWPDIESAVAQYYHDRAGCC